MDDGGWFVIDQAMIDEHINEMRRRQLGAARSVFGWMQAYNKYTAFIIRNCGTPVTVYGVEHVNAIIDTLVRIQRTLFEEGVITAVRKMTEEQFGVNSSSLLHGLFVWSTRMLSLPGRKNRSVLVSVRA